MPRYLFEIRDGHARTDLDSVDLPDLVAVRREAAMVAGRLLMDNPARFWKQQHLAVEVREDTGLVLFTLYVDAVLAPALVSPTARMDRGAALR